MLRPIMAQVVRTEATKEHAGIAEEANLADLADLRPARGTVGRNMPVLPRAPERTDDRRSAAEKTARARQHPGLVKHLRRIGVVVIPPVEKLPGSVDREMPQDHPRQAELRLIAEHGGGPLGRDP
jgi:hypothetical protein